MNLLSGHICYLSGSMECAKDGGTKWRKIVTPQLHSMGIGVIDPTDKPILEISLPNTQDRIPETPEMRQKVKLSKDVGDYSLVKKVYKEIVHEDLRYTDLAGFLYVYLNIEDYPTGTYDEIFMAANQQKPVIIVSEQGKKGISNWLYGRLVPELFFDTIEESIDYLKRVNAGLEPTMDRWVFVDYDKIFGKGKYALHQ